MSRLGRLADGLSEPLLVTYPVNVQYLTGFESSNSAVLVEPGEEHNFRSTGAEPLVFLCMIPLQK